MEEFILYDRLKIDFFIDFDENAHEGSASDGESESVLILKKIVLYSGSKINFLRFLKQKHP